MNNVKFRQKYSAIWNISLYYGIMFHIRDASAKNLAVVISLSGQSCRKDTAGTVMNPNLCRNPRLGRHSFPLQMADSCLGSVLPALVPASFFPDPAQKGRYQNLPFHILTLIDRSNQPYISRALGCFRRLTSRSVSRLRRNR